MVQRQALGSATIVSPDVMYAVGSLKEKKEEKESTQIPIGGPGKEIGTGCAKKEKGENCRLEGEPEQEQIRM